MARRAVRLGSREAFESGLREAERIYLDELLQTEDAEEGLRAYLEYSGQVDAEGKRKSADADVLGRRHSRWLSMMYPRLILARNLLTQDGVLVITAQRFRSQERNRQDALDRLVALIRRAATPPRPRRPTRPTAAARERRLAGKARRSRLKRERAAPDQ